MEHMPARYRARNIPAYAGKTFLAKRPGNLPKEHPRVRGENTLLVFMGFNLGGTSPRARGKPMRKRVIIIAWRNIPACAGKTSPGEPAFRRKKEHPRVRGENHHGAPG